MNWNTTSFCRWDGLKYSRVLLHQEATSTGPQVGKSGDLLRTHHGILPPKRRSGSLVFFLGVHYVFVLWKLGSILLRVDFQPLKTLWRKGWVFAQQFSCRVFEKNKHCEETKGVVLVYWKFGCIVWFWHIILIKFIEKKSLTATLSNNHTIKRYFIVEFNETNVILHMLVYFSINLVKFFEIWLKTKLKQLHQKGVAYPYLQCTANAASVYELLIKRRCWKMSWSSVITFWQLIRKGEYKLSFCFHFLITPWIETKAAHISMRKSKLDACMQAGTASFERAHDL